MEANKNAQKLMQRRNDAQGMTEAKWSDIEEVAPRVRQTEFINFIGSRA